MESYAVTCAKLIQRHMLDAYGWEATLEELLDEPLHKHVWAWWRALAYYQVDHHYFDLSDVVDPTDGLEVVVISDKSRDCYVFRKGRWRLEELRTILKSDMKAIYG